MTTHIFTDTQSVLDSVIRIGTTVALIVGGVWRVARKYVNRIVDDGLNPIRDELRAVNRRLDKHISQSDRQLTRITATMVAQNSKANAEADRRRQME